MPNLAKRLARATSEIHRRGLRNTIGRVYSDWRLGRQVEMRNNRIEYRGIQLDLSNPLIKTRMKSTFIEGHYERPELDLVERCLPGDLPVVELGASIGVVACFTNCHLNDRKRHVVVEANPRLIPSLLTNASLNNCEFSVEQSVIAYGGPNVSFYQGETFLAGATGNRRRTAPIEVATTSLAALLDKYKFDKADLIADIEGAEADLITHESNVLQSRIRWFIFENHPTVLGAARVEELLSHLSSLGFIRRATDCDVVALENVNITL